jgi:hypothetical protein
LKYRLKHTWIYAKDCALADVSFCKDTSTMYLGLPHLHTLHVWSRIKSHRESRIENQVPLPIECCRDAGNNQGSTSRMSSAQPRGLCRKQAKQKMMEMLSN